MLWRRKTIRGIFWSLGSIAFIDAVLHSVLPHSKTFYFLVLLLMVVELFPVRVGVIRYTPSFPLLFAMGLISNFPFAAVVSVILLLVQYPFVKRHRKLIGTLGWMSARAIALLLAGWCVKFPQWIGIPRGSVLPYGLYVLVATTVVFSVVCNLIVYWTAPASRNLTGGVRDVLRLIAVDIALSLGYDGFMLWLASNPKNVQTGSIGTVFFFLPLVFATLVLHLISNLTQAKTQLETLLELSKSINEQGELRDVVDRITEAAKRLVSSSHARLLLSSGDGVFQTVFEPDGSQLIQVTDGIVSRVSRTHEPCLVENIQDTGDLHLREMFPSAKSAIAVPVLSSTALKGVLIVSHQHTSFFHQEDVNLLILFANHASIVLDNADYMEERDKRVIVEERNRLARDIHDGIAQELASAALQLELIRRYPEELDTRLGQVYKLLTQSIRDIRQSIYSLRPQPYAHIGLVPAIEKYLRQLEQTSGLRVQFETNGSTRRIGSDHAEVIYQVVQEACQNTVKHAHALNLSVRLNVTDDECLLVVADDGVGFHLGQTILRAAERKSFGIENLHLLVERIGASIEYDTAPQAGTRVEVSIPLKESEASEERIHLTV